jgi:hypothetical protein
MIAPNGSGESSVEAGHDAPRMGELLGYRSPGLVKAYTSRSW